MQSKLSSVAFAVAVVFACTGCAGPAVSRSDPLPGSKQVNNGTVLSDQGPFQFTGITISPTYSSSANVAGRVTNNTPKQWKFANFEMTLFDEAGRKIGLGLIGFRDFSPGQTQPIGLAGYESLRVDDGRKIRSFDLKFVNGAFQAQYVFSMTKPTAAADMVFGDDLIEIHFVPAEKQIGFTIRNKSAGPAKIDWNSAAFVDIAGASHKVMHDGVKFTDRANMQAPTVIPPGASVRDFVYPSDYVSYVSGRYGGWTELAMFPDAPKANAYKGFSFGVFLPIEIDGKVKNYNFVFRINDVIS